ncbi:MAG TPA: GNAT family N-acetyltransferase, partial [Candidatus Limnocylindrales bacterium]
GLDDFLAVMGGAYRWSDDGRSDAWAELYRLPLPDGAEPLRHVVVRDAGQPAACASLFTAGGHAFVTNVGTIPAARGRGLGTLATLAVLDVAAGLGARKATLTASRMGRSVYARIGFYEDALLRRWISPA